MRYVLKYGEESFVKYINWIAGGVIPSSISIGTLDDALIVKEDYLELIDDRVEKSRRELILERFPEIKMIPIAISLENGTRDE